MREVFDEVNVSYTVTRKYLGVLGIGIAARVAHFYGGIELLIYHRQSMVSVSMQPILQMCQETVVLFLFAMGAACALVGTVYSVMTAWQRIGPPTTYPDDKES
ncbi:hypothetical protein NVI2019_PEGOAJLN_03780 (plasmid) [Providencia alcalifaciens]|nr:hypothetical protein NVI2019_PEGOAJLN_03780 [Providencia alcalifaciens]